MISNVLGYTTSEFVDEIVICFMSIYSLGQAPTIIFDYAKFIVDKIHDQFMRLENERMFKYSLVMYHLFLYYKDDRFPISLQNMDTKGNPRLVIFWILLVHQFDSQYSYTYFIDLFVHPVIAMLLGSPPP